MRRPYSRLASVEERRNIRNAILLILISIAALGILFFYGIPAIGKFAAFVSDIGKGNKPITSVDVTPPAPPKFDTFTNFTNQQNFSISGSSESGATVKLVFNGKETDALTDKDGRFQFNLQLDNGENSFSALAMDSAGNVSQRTQEYKITFDNKPPTLTITGPSDSSQFFGSGQRQVTIKGTTDADTTVTINDRIIVVDDNGNFQYTTTLESGANTFVIKSQDAAGNSTEKDLTLNFTP